MKPESINDKERYSVVTVAGLDTPNYLSIVRDGLPLPVNRYDMSLTRAFKGVLTWYEFDRATKGTGPWRPRYSGKLQRYGAEGSTFYLDPTGNISSIWNLMQNEIAERKKVNTNRFLSKMKPVSLSVLMMFNERKATGELVLGFLDKMIGAARAVRHPSKMFRILRGRNPTAAEKRRLNNIRRRGPAQQVLGDKLLEYHFAWTPLLDDINDSLSAFKDAEDRLKSESTRSGYQIYGERNEVNWATVCPYNVNLVYNAYGHIKCWWRVGNPFCAVLANLQNPAAFLWDAVPWSFIINWVANIGQWLDLQTATLGLEFVKGYQTYYVKARATASPTTGEWVSGNRLYKGVGVYPPLLHVSMQRRVLAGFPAPQLIIKKPEQLFDWFKVTILSGLLGQKVRVR